LSLKALLGAAVVIIISLAAHMKNYYLAGLYILIDLMPLKWALASPRLYGACPPPFYSFCG